MSINFFRYYMKEGFANLFKNKKSTFSSIMIMSFTLLLFGVFIIMSTNVNKIVDNLKTQENMVVFIDVNATDSETEELRKKIDNIKIEDKKAVINIKYVSKEAAVEVLNEKFGNPDLFKSIYGDKIDFLPASFNLQLESLEDGPKVKTEIESFPHVKSVGFDQQIIGTILGFFKTINIINISLVVILIISSVFIISNTIKLTVFSRRKEISIMKYVGASDGFIRGPFVFEAILMGLISTILPILALAGLYKMVEQGLVQLTQNQALGLQSSVNIVHFSTILPTIIIAFLALAIGLAVIGSVFSMKKYLKV